MGKIHGKFQRAVLHAVKPLVERLGGTCYLASGNRAPHGKMYIVVGGVTRYTPIPGTPTADLEDAVRMKVSDVKRILREIKAGKRNL